MPVGDPISFHDLQYCSTVSDSPYFLWHFHQTYTLYLPTYMADGQFLYVLYTWSLTCVRTQTHTHTTPHLTLTLTLYSWHPNHQVVRHRGGLQCAGDGAAGAQSRGPLQLLWAQVQSQDSVATGRPAGETLTDTPIHSCVTLGFHSSSLFHLWLLIHKEECCQLCLQPLPFYAHGLLSLHLPFVPHFYLPQTPLHLPQTHLISPNPLHSTSSPHSHLSCSRSVELSSFTQRTSSTVM